MAQEAASPQNTHALIVGIERYKAGATWNLDGPGSDAVRFMEYLNRRGVPRANVTAFLEPLDVNAADLTTRAEAVATSPRQPTQEAIMEFLTGPLPGVAQADLFVVFWSGHGTITEDGARRLFTTDAIDENRRNLDLNDLMGALLTTQYAGLNRQVFLIDACANYVYNPTVTLPTATLPRTDKIAGREQFALLAGAPGEYAKNLNAEKTGLFSRELMAVLPESGSWPPDFPSIGQTLAERFIGLRQAGKAKQTPTTFWQRDWLGSETLLKDFDDRKVPPLAVSSLPRQLSIAETKRLSDAFLAVTQVKRAAGRDNIIDLLSPRIASRVPRSDVALHDVVNMITTARAYAGGLADLLTAVEMSDANSLAVQALLKTARQMLPEEVPDDVPEGAAGEEGDHAS